MTRKLCFAAFALAAQVAAAASTAPAVPHAWTADELIAKNIEARGGLTKLKAIHSLKTTGKLVFGGGEFSIEAALARVVGRPSVSRQELTLQGLTAVDAWDGHEGWRVQPFQGRRDPERVSADEAKQLEEEADLEGPLVGYKEKGHRVEYLGTEDVDGTPAYKLRVSLKNGDLLYLYLDPDYFLTIREVAEHKVRGAEEIEETDVGSYTQVAGVWFPFSFESGPQGRPRRVRITLEHGEANGPADEALFHFPAPGIRVGKALQAANGGAQVTTAPPAPSASEKGPTVDVGVLSGLGARNIGSAAMSGRIAALAARNEGGKTTIYVGAASGGVWKSIDSGTTFRPVFDKQPVQSIGAITIDPSNPRTLWVGTGESWTRNSVSVGNGIYRSTDAGESWTHMGLPNSERISRILVHPTDSNRVLACVPGKLWSDSAERGLYQTTDGGKTWALVLKGNNLSTGCASVTMDPKDPNVLFASLWDFRRKGWTFRSGGEGPEAKSGSGLFRSADGGKTWAEVTGHGLAKQPWGRVDVVIAPSDSKVVYAFVESTDSALFRSSDGGATWEARDKSQSMVWRPFYFARMVVDPTRPDHLFKANGQLIVSDDGGRSFAGTAGRGAHGDWHDLWIDPQNPQHVLGGDDGGLWISWDGGNRWWKSGNLPISQFYHVAVDAQDPYKVYGGLQDNSSWMGDSATPGGGGITNARWENLWNGDGFWVVPDPSDPDQVYAEAQGGFIGRINKRTKAARDIQPKAGFHEKLRFNWNAPIYASPTQKGTLYLGAQFLFRSKDHGDTWDRISPDLSTNDPQKQKQEESGGVTVDNSSAEMHTTIYAISESPKDAKVLWVGTDDGNLQLSRDSGKTWTNTASQLPGVPAGSWVSWVEASRFAPGTAYAAIDRHTFGDLNPWVFRTTDFGKTWTRLGTPEQGVRGYAHVIKEDIVQPNLLFLGTEFGLWVSVDAGASWAQFKGGGFPSVAVRDLQIHPREHDLVLATHGRGIWIVDDISPLRAVSEKVLAQDAAFVASRPVQQRMPSEGGWPEGDATFAGENPSGGAVVTYYQRTRHLFGPIKMEVLDAKGNLVDTLSPTKRRGLNRVAWTMQVKPPRVPRAAVVAFSASQGPRVVPGTYTVRLTKGDRVVETKLEIGIDRRAPYTVADRKQQYDAVMKVHALFGEMSALVDRMDQTSAELGARLAALGPTDAARAPLAQAGEQLTELKKKIVATKEGGAITGEERIREHTDMLYSALLKWEGRPAKYQLERTDVLRRELDEVRSGFDALVKTLPAGNPSHKGGSGAGSGQPQ